MDDGQQKTLNYVDDLLAMEDKTTFTRERVEELREIIDSQEEKLVSEERYEHIVKVVEDMKPVMKKLLETIDSDLRWQILEVIKSLDKAI